MQVNFNFLYIGNADASTKATIKANNYQALLTYLQEPAFTLSDIDDGSLPRDGLAFACLSEDDVVCDIYGALAGAFQQEDDINGNIIGFCPRFFDTVDLDFAIESYSGGDCVNTMGFDLLHEVQHVSGIVSPESRCTDHRDPVTNDPCYDTEW